MKVLLAFFVSAALLAAQVIDGISAQSMKGHLSFLASDLLEGRKTPSRGLEIAAEYIAAQFRGAGLEPAGDRGTYFQTATMVTRQIDTAKCVLRVQGADQLVVIDPKDFLVRSTSGAHGADLPVVKLKKPESLAGLEIAGKVVILERRIYAPIRVKLEAAGPAAIVTLSSAAAVRGAPRAQMGPASVAATPAVIVVGSPDLQKLFESWPEGITGAKLTLDIPKPNEELAVAKNVAGLLRGSDPALKETFVLLTAHYDHLGMKPDGEGDRNFNGANDDGSGTVGVVEIAVALSRLKTRPKRSILFMTYFGEEQGLVGSKYYSEHPLVPIQHTVAQINMEQIGRTDDSEGPQIRRAAVTGFDYSDVGSILEAAGKTINVVFYMHPKNSSAYFNRSDNGPLAALGVPAHTVGVSFEFPDYHTVGDEWEKIDYVNMEAIVKAVGLGLLRIANSDQAPKWSTTNPEAGEYAAKRTTAP